MRTGQPLIDHTADYLQEAAEACRTHQDDRLFFEVVCLADTVMIRGYTNASACPQRQIMTDAVPWAEVTGGKANPLLVVLSGVAHRLARHLAQPTENRQKS